MFSKGYSTCTVKELYMEMLKVFTFTMYMYCDIQTKHISIIMFYAHNQINIETLQFVLFTLLCTAIQNLYMLYILDILLLELGSIRLRNSGWANDSQAGNQGQWQISVQKLLRFHVGLCLVRMYCRSLIANPVTNAHVCMCTCYIHPSTSVFKIYTVLIQNDVGWIPINTKQ